VRKRKFSGQKKRGTKGLSSGPIPMPVAPLSRRPSRMIVAPAAQHNYYLELADIALEGKPASRAGRKQTGKP
jgi:hypothetical protein